MNAEQVKLVGKQSIQVPLIMFLSDDIEHDYQKLKARGVHFHGEPTPVPGGKGVGFEDLYGNLLDLFQPDQKV